MLVLCLVALRGRSGPQVLHNWSTSSRRFTDDFAARLAGDVRPSLGGPGIVMPAELTSTIKLLAVVPATVLFLLPLRLIMAITRAMTPSQVDSIVLYCDAHLAGFAISLAMKTKGTETLTLQHGLYRSDDRGSRMDIRNFVSDRILLWDRATCDQFRAAGCESSRLQIVGQYGFADPTPCGPIDHQLVLLCPPYQSENIAHFGHIDDRLPKSFTTKWSLHPMRRQSYPEHEQAVLATVSPKPKLAICGDSGVLMEALARSIPVITVSERVLAKAHLTYDQVSSLGPADIELLFQRAINNLKADQEAFGFGPTRELRIGLQGGEG